MTRFLIVGLLAVILSSCGADGEPVKPTYEARTTFGFGSSGTFNRTSFGVIFGSS
ncbi:MAG: argininosuccinate lyase [Paracoccaceae bacterium]|nr:argininosuccinate lyase [Paracoccaceae bacterium]